MNKYAICPRYIERCTTLGNKRDLADVLIRFAQTNSFKILTDSKLNLIERYRTISDNDGLCAYWLTLLLDSPDNIHKVTINSPETLNDNELSIALTKAIPTNRKIVVREPDDYAKFISEVRSNCISLLDPNEIRDVINKGPIINFNYEELTQSLVDKALRMTERKRTHAIEDIHNDLITDFLRDKGYSVADQTRSGSSNSGKTAGELDIAIRKANGGAIESIIEALRLSSCGPANKTVVEHLNKLLHSYDTAGCARNFILVYAENQNFNDLWINYFNYIQNINSNREFVGTCKLTKITEVTNHYSNKTDLRVALTEHDRNGGCIQVMHIFANFHVPQTVAA